MAEHDGYTYGFRSLATVYPDLKIGLFTCLNGKLSVSSAMLDIHRYVTDLLFNGTDWKHGDYC